MGSAQEAMAKCADAPEVSVIGGGEIYRLFWPLAHRLYLTEVDVEVQGDTTFPPVEAGEWRESSREVHAAGPNDSAAFTLRVLDRVTSE